MTCESLLSIEHSSATCLLDRVGEFSTKELRSQVSLLSIEFGFLILRGLCAGTGELGAGVRWDSGELAAGAGGELGG